MALTTRQFIRPLAPAVHGGVDAAELARLGVDPAAVIDFSANQSPLGPSPAVAAAVAAAVLDAYPDRDARPLTAAIAEAHGVSDAHVVAGNGSTELIRLIAQLVLAPGDRAMALAPTFGEYDIATRLAGAVYEPVTLDDWDAIASFLYLQRPRLLWLCSPNNPTGAAVPPALLARLVRGCACTLVVLDEAYCDLLPAPQWDADLLAAGNLIVLRSMTKAWGLAGVRLGYALGDPALMTPLREAKPPWNVNACAQAAGLSALADPAHHDATVALLRTERARLMDALRAQGWTVRPSDAAFFLIEVDDAAAVRAALLTHGCLVRDCTSFGLPGCVRVSPRHPAQNDRLLAAFAAVRGTV
jgi:L-threonine-O-3-phosphate decarboxylase